MSTSSERPTSSEVESEAEGTRAELAGTLEQLRDNLKPENVVDEVFFNAKIGASTLSDRAWALAKEHPVPALLIAAGTAMMLGVGARTATHKPPEPSYPDGARGLPRPRQLRSPTVFESVVRGTASMAALIGGPGGPSRTTPSATEPRGALGTGDFRRNSSTSFGDRAMSRSKKSRGNYARDFQAAASTPISSILRDQPLILGAIGVAVGAAIGAALPTTDTEDSLMGSASHSVKQAAQDVAQREVAELRAVAGRAVDNVKQSVAEHGLSTDNLTDLAHDVGDHAKSALHEATDSLNKAAKPS